MIRRECYVLWKSFASLINTQHYTSSTKNTQGQGQGQGWQRINATLKPSTSARSHRIDNPKYIYMKVVSLSNHLVLSYLLSSVSKKVLVQVVAKESTIWSLEHRWGVVQVRDLGVCAMNTRLALATTRKLELGQHEDHRARCTSETCMCMEISHTSKYIIRTPPA